jgi:hypothetical protein
VLPFRHQPAVGLSPGERGARLPVLPKRLGKNWDRWRPGRFGNGRGVPGLLWGDALGQSLVRALGDVELVEPVNYFLQLPVAECQRRLVQSRKEGLVEELTFPCVLGLYVLPVIALTPSGVT